MKTNKLHCKLATMIEVLQEKQTDFYIQTKYFLMSSARIKTHPYFVRVSS